ncbi:hypothetical protein BSL78_07812 [Apostichopus japonicus]|uniref:Uncharacterized protein n=1 Tax=Stichopus japonicus TaxID=307972 RepID=A0A2G8L4V1_STIJA|nr:hypothetical protein BSL78_07812 [Apostichopus japonicus]
MAEQGKYENPLEIKSDHGSSSESVDENTTAQTKSATLPRTHQDEGVYASMSPIPAQRNTCEFQKSPIPGSPTDIHEARSFFHVKDERDSESTFLERTEDFPESIFGPPGPSLPPKITPPSRPPPLPTRKNAHTETASTEVPTSPKDPQTPLYVTSPIVHLYENGSTESPLPRKLSDAPPSEEKKLAKQLLSGIGEKYGFIKGAVDKYKVFNKELSGAAEGLKDRITESAEESMRNIEWIEKTLLKDVRIRSETEDHGAEIIHNALQTFLHLEKQVQELQTSNRGDQEIIGKSLDICANLRRLLRRDIVNWENKDVLLVENYCDLSVGTLLNKMITRCVGIVGLNEQNAIVVIDQRESLGICFGLWSKLINKCTKWEVMFQPKNTASQVVLSSNLGEDKRGSPVIVIGIEDTLYFVQTKKLFDKETGLAARETETSVGSD